MGDPKCDNPTAAEIKALDEDFCGMLKRTEEVCEEARAFFDLMARAGELDAKAEAEIKQKAEECGEHLKTLKNLSAMDVFFGTMGGVTEALDANEIIVGNLLDKLMEEIKRHSGDDLAATMNSTATMTVIDVDGEPQALELEKLLAECEALRDETVQYRGLQNTLRFDKSINL